MGVGRHSRWERAVAAAAALLLCLAAACATSEPPGGGPVDLLPPAVTQVRPDSGSVGLAGLRDLEIVFSEKVDPLPAPRFMHLYPPLEIAGTKWHGRRRASVTLRDPLPPDTVVVVEIPRGYADVHRVKSMHSRRYPLATADSLPPGEIRGHLTFDDAAAAGAVVELYAVPPDTLAYFQQDVLRRAEADSTGRFVLPWLYVPGGPYLLRVFIDRNGDLRPADSEPQRLLPGEVRLTAAAPTADAGAYALYDPHTPGRLLGFADSLAVAGRSLFGWTQGLADDDTGFVASHLQVPPPNRTAVLAGDTTIFAPAGPGPVRLVLFADLNGDSLLSALPDSSAAPDTVLWRWEPYAVEAPLEIEPGLDLPVALPAVPDSLRPCLVPPPAPAPADTSAPADAATDSAAVAPAAARPDSSGPPAGGSR